MKELRIFISYSHDDEGIAGPLSNLLQAAFGPVLVEAFLDKSAISFGASIKKSVLEALERADLLMAVIAGARPASTLSWPAFEIGTFSAFWEDKHYKQGPHKDRDKAALIGQVIAVVNHGRETTEREKDASGPLQGQRHVDLGISEKWLSAGDDQETLTKARNAASFENDELLTFLRDIEQMVKLEPDYIQYAKGRNKGLPDLVRDFKIEVFEVLRNRVRDTSKPTKQLLVRTKVGLSSLPNDAKLLSVAGGCEVFGKNEGDPRLFKRTECAVPGSERYEAEWGAFADSVKDNPYGAYWCRVIEQVATSAISAAADLDPNLVLISNRGQRYRIIPTTITAYYNNYVEVSLYLIEALQRQERGDTETSKLLNLLILVCRFRFAFFEGTSPYYWRNFESRPANPRDLLMELDYLRSEATNANIDKPGAYEGFMPEQKLSDAMRIWKEIELGLRNACNMALMQPDNVSKRAEINANISAQLKRIYEEIKPFNALLGVAVSDQLLNVFKRDQTTAS